MGLSSFSRWSLSFSEVQCAGEGWQELRDDLSYWRQVATSNFAEGTWFLSPTSTTPGLVLCLLMEMALVPVGADHGLEDSTCAGSHGPIPTQ